MAYDNLDLKRLTDEERSYILQLVQVRGEREVTSMLEISRSTLGRCLAGLTVQRATVALIRQRLAVANA